MKQKRSENNYFEDAPAWSAIAHMSIPMMLGLCVNLIYNIVDAFFIGQLHQTPMLSAIALALPLFSTQMAVGNLFGTGGGTFISRLLGEKKPDEAKKVATVTVFYSLLAGTVFLALLLPLLPFVLRLLGAAGDTLAPTHDFVLVMLLGTPAMIANGALEQVVRAEGASKTSMLGMGFSVAVNIALDPVFLFCCHLGVAGAALATVLGNVAAVAFYIVWLKRRSPHLDISFSLFRPTVRMTGEIFKIGVTALIDAAFLTVSALLFNNLLAAHGDAAVAAVGISQRVVQLPDFIGMGLFMGAVPLIAYAFSAGNLNRMLEVIRKTAAAVTILVLVVAGAMFLFRTQVLALFSSDPRVVETGLVILAALLLASLFTSLTGLFTGIFQGIGREKEAAVMSSLQGVLFIPIMFAGNAVFGLNGVIWSLTVSQAAASIIGLALWLHFRKKTVGEAPVSDDVPPLSPALEED